MYKSAADALVGLVSGKEKEVAKMPWSIKMGESPSVMQNGVEYFYVEVTFANGAQYGIPAYGDEARELRRQATELKGPRRLLEPMLA